jgi:Phosphoesterase family
VPPPQDAPNPDNMSSTNPVFEFTRLGVRVPAVVISPWIDPLTIDSTRYEHASIATTARKLFLGESWQTKFLNKRDQAANSFDRNLTRDTPRTDVVNFFAPQHAPTLARARDPQQAAVRIAQHAALPLSELQRTLVAQTHFVNQTLHPDAKSTTPPHVIQTERDAAAFHNEVMSQVLPPKVQVGRA